MFANVVLVAKFLEVLDSLEAAQKVIDSQGLDLVVQKFHSVLASEGIKEVVVKTGDIFDPNLHEALETVVGKEEGKITDILEKGYQLEGKIIRPARVRVSRVAEKPTAPKG